MFFPTNGCATAGRFILAAGFAFLLSVFVVRAQDLPDDTWTGNWSGTYAYATPCGVSNTGNITVSFTVSNGSLSGSGLEDSVTCYDGQCNVTGFGTFSGTLFGNVSGSNITFSGTWFDTCNNMSYPMDFQGTLVGGAILGTDNIKLVKLSESNSCTVDANTLYQRIDGFGGASAFIPSFTEAQADMFFSTNTGIGLSLLRSRIAPDGTTAESSIMQMAQARGARVWSTPWSPPANFKDSGTVDGGNFVSTFNQAYANQLADYVLNMKTTYGVDIYAVSIQNEPTYNTQRYESCIWNGQQFHDFIPYLYQALSNNGVGSTKIIMPEEAGWDFALAPQSMNDPVTSNMVDILAGHGYFNEAAQVYNYNKTLWQSEAAGFDGFDGSINNGIYWANQIHLFMTLSRANAFVYWWLLAQSPDNEGLTDELGNPTKRMYVLGQYARFVRPGFVRIGAFNNNNAEITAYKDPASGNFAIVAINPNATTLTQTFNLTNFTTGLVTPWITSGDLSLAVQTPVLVSNATFSYVMPAQSVITFVGETNNVTIVTQPKNQTVAAGDTAVFSVSALGAPPLYYFWQQNGAAITGATNSIYSFTNVPASASGSLFNCVVSNAIGAVTSAVATLTVATPLYAFHGSDGSNPCAALIQATDGNLYGTAQNGGAYGFGTVFGLTTNGVLTTLVSFNDTNGAIPLGGLVQGADGYLYGTTELGGANNAGTVFKMTTDGQLTTLYSFDGDTGYNPSAGLVPSDAGNFYGTAGGSIFSITTNGTLNTLASFDSSTTGATPHGNLILGSDGNFYGTTSSGGNSGHGTIFQMTPGGTLTAVASFTDGNSLGGLLQPADGNFYGTTATGGTAGDGTVFRMTPNGALSVLRSFNPSVNSGGSQPYAGLALGSNGNFYGTTSAGGKFGDGSVFGTDSNGVLSTVLSFAGVDGANPHAAVMQGADGGFYGTTVYGGIGWNGTATSGNGVVFRLPFPSPPTITGQPLSQPVRVGGNATLSVTAASTSPLQYIWLRNGAIINGATNSSLTFTNIVTPTIGNYDVIVTNSFGSVTSAVVTLTFTNAVCVEPPPGMVTWWQGQSNAVDIIGGQNGVPMNGAGFTNALVGDGFVFEGGTDYIQLPQNIFPLPNGQPCTLELWFQTTTGGVILEQQNGAPFAGVPNGWLPELYVGTDGNLYAQLYWNGYFAQISTRIPVNDGGFHHLAVTYDGINEVVYVDGGLVGAELLPSSTYANGFYCQLGTGYTQNWPGGNGGWFTFNGIIDEVTIYSNALTPPQIRAIYNADNAGKCTDELLPIFTAQPTNTSVLAGGTAVFNVSTASLVPLTFQWFAGSNAIAGATNATLTLLRVPTLEAGGFSVVANNFYGSSTSAVAILTVTNLPCVEPPPGLIAWWPGEGNATDIIGGNNGVLMNGAGFTNGLVNRAFVFDGGADYVQLPSNLYPLPNAAPFSIELWFETSSGGVILAQQDVPNGWVPELYVGTDGNLRAQLFWNGSFAQVTTSTPVNDGNFHHLAVTYDGATEVLYIDAVRVGSESLPYSTYTSNFACQLGAGYTSGWPGGIGGTFAFNGIIDEPSLYSNALTPAQILTLYQANSGGKCTGGQLLPVVIAQPTNQVVIAGGTAVFTIAATSPALLSYQWLSGATALTGATNASLALTNVPVSDTGAQIACVVSNVYGISNSTVAVLTVIPVPDPTPPAIPHVSLLSNGNIQMTVTGSVGSEFRVLASTNLTDWQTIATLTNATGTLQFTDPDTTNFTSRYYRLVTP